MGNLSAGPLLRVPHCPAHRVDRRPGDKALEPGDLLAGLFVGETRPDKDEAENTVTLYQECNEPRPRVREDDSTVGYMREISGFGNLGDCLGDG